MIKKPKHVAIIMDGNGRWATKQGKKRFAGHNRGAKTVSKIVEQAAKEKIKYLTLFAFSTENWNRPKEEVNILMKLLVSSLRKEFARLTENNIKLSSLIPIISFEVCFINLNLFFPSDTVKYFFLAFGIMFETTIENISSLNFFFLK